MAPATITKKSCQEGKVREKFVTHCEQRKNKFPKCGTVPPCNLLF